MNRILPAAIALTAALTLAGCTAGAPDSSSPSSPSSASGGTSASDVASIYYPVALGNTWVYSIDYGSGSTVTDTEVMTAVKPEGDATRVTISRTFHYEDGSKDDLLDTVDYLFHADGSLEVPFQSIPSDFGVVTIKSGTMVWPTTAEFDAGTTRTGTIEASVDTSGTTTNEKVDFTISGAGTEDVTVPAGSYPGARKLQQALVISLPDLGVSGIAINAVTWLAEGVGPVKTELPDMAGGSATITQVLVSFTPGG